MQPFSTYKRVKCYDLKVGGGGHILPYPDEKNNNVKVMSERWC